MRDEPTRTITCQVEGDTVVVKLCDEAVLYLSRDEAYRLWYQVGDIAIETFVLDDNENVIGYKTDVETVEVAGVVLSVQEGRHLLDALDPCLDALDEMHSEDWEIRDKSIGEKATQKENWMKEGF